MKYNKRYRKPDDKSIEAQAFWDSMMQGQTAQEYVDVGLKVIREFEK